MRTKIKVVGIGNRMSGVSKKNGKAYDFLPVSFVYEDQNFHGFRAATANIDGPMLDAAGMVKVDEQREIFFHTWNNNIVVDGIL